MKSRPLAAIIAAAIFLTMLAFTVRALAVRGVFDQPAEMVADVWFQASLVDAYLCFFMLWVWIAYCVRNWVTAAIWFVLVMSFGSMAIALYAFWRLARAPANAGVGEALFGRSPD
jgi:hypothetical protein